MSVVRLIVGTRSSGPSASQGSVASGTYGISWQKGTSSPIDYHIPLLCYELLWPASNICVSSNARHDIWMLLLSPRPLQGHRLANKQNHKTKVFDRHMALSSACLLTFDRRKKLTVFLYLMLSDFQKNFAFFLEGRFIILTFWIFKLFGILPREQILFAQLHILISY